MSSFRDAVGIPSTDAQVPVDIATFVSYVIPPLACYFAMAVLSVTSHTRTARIALWPAVALLALRAVVSVDMSLGDPGKRWVNLDLVQSMLFVAIRTLQWTLTSEPLVRHLRPANGSPSTIMDALDLTTNLRGIGWNWSRGLYVPRETRPTSRIAFLFYVLMSAVAHGTISGIIHLTIRAFSTTAHGYTIFDETLPFFLRYFRSSIISTLGAFGIYAVMQLRYDIYTLVGVLLLGQDPAQWPCALDSPWRSTSLSEFWSQRWHQFFRDIFLIVAYPFTVVFGRVGTVLGVFFASGLYHHIVMVALDNRTQFWRMLVPFVMMAPAVLAEAAFYRWTGRRVGGFAGWVWTVAWLVLWGNVMTDGFAKAGMYMCVTPVDDNLPLHGVVEKLVVNFDAWLHTI